MECMKENKKRFFRKGGQAHRSQRSFDNHTGSAHCCRAPAQSPSIDSMSLASGTVTPVHVQVPKLQQQPQLPFQKQQLQQLPKQQQLSGRVTSSPCPPGIMNSNTLVSTRHGVTNSSGGTNSCSLDEAEINMNCHRRFMPAPRRARSAERFDGMRVAYNGGGSGELPVLTRQTTDDILSRSYRSPQILRTVENNGSPSTIGVGTAAAPTRRAIGPKTSLEGVVYPVPSPPPSYTTAIRDPPPYHQVVAAMKQPMLISQTVIRGTPVGKVPLAPLNNRYITSQQQHQFQQSHSVTTTPTGSQHHGMRSVASTPIFASIDPVCSCHKCQIADPNAYGTDNDAVYMESQAFLMNEIMSDGMAFCSIV